MQSGPTGKGGKLKIIIKTPQSHTTQDDGMDESANGDDSNAEYMTALTEELFTADELGFPVDKLYRKCYWETKWAEDVGDALKKECKEWEEYYYKEWLEKEVLLAQVIKSEVDWHERRQAILSGAANVQLPRVVESQDREQTNGAQDGDESRNGTQIEVAPRS